MTEPTLKALPFHEAIDFFRKKGYKPTFRYQDMEPQAHATAFTVAKAMRTDILQDIRSAMDDAIANGHTFDTFKGNLKPTLADKGWWGRKKMVDPDTGEERTVQLGSSKRLRTIFDVNMRQAYATGHWEQAQRTKNALPFLRYVPSSAHHPRAAHRLWYNVVKPIDDPFWDKHLPPNGWGCQCSVQQLAQEDLDHLGLEVTKYDPSGPEKTYVNRRTGQLMRAPQGVDPNFAYNPGKERMKALTPPPLDVSLDTPYAGPPSHIPLPKPRAASASSLMLPPDLTPEEYMRHFLGRFGADIGKPVVITDKAGEPVTISEDLFKNGRGQSTLMKRGRHLYLPMLAETILNPDEIWNVWENYPEGRPTLLRRYIAHFSVEGQAQPGFALFDTSAAGWTGVTTFQPDRRKYLIDQRKGALIYRRPDDVEKK
ncbi:MAG: hypothetical protein GC185_01830 [Alphaproteobacteria bacterium]|nr:hypothetical protein [Alphaproteobacteria bacterium]